MLLQIEYLSDFTRTVAPKMVEAGLAVLRPEVERSLDQAIGRNLKYESQTTGELLQSLSASRTFIRDAGQHFKGNLYFKGVRKDGFRNAEIAAYKEYGTPQRKNHDQAPSPFRKSAVARARAKVLRRMEQVLEKELKGQEEVK